MGWFYVLSRSVLRFIPFRNNRTLRTVPTTQPGNSTDANLSLPVLPEGTPVKLQLQHSLHSKTVVVDDPLNFLVAEDVIVDGKQLIGTGAVAIGRVQQAMGARTWAVAPS